MSNPIISTTGIIISTVTGKNEKLRELSTNHQSRPKIATKEYGEIQSGPEAMCGRFCFGLAQQFIILS